MLDPSPPRGALTAATKAVRLAAVGDVHCKRGSEGAFRELFASASQLADVLVLCGDLTDYGTPEEAEVLAAELRAGVRVPVVAVLGNHDFESGKQDEVKAIVARTGAVVLDGDSCEIGGVGFAGAKGFGGGFGDRMLGPWGEAAIKLFVHEAVEEALKLETALRRLETAARVVLLHYAPIEETVVGEPAAIYPFLGSSRLEEPLERYPVTAVFHGHAHHGALQGRTRTGVPVFNVCLPLLRAASPDRPPLRLIDVPVAADR
jgi:Icc-related predicted phosphoesterase